MSNDPVNEDAERPSGPAAIDRDLVSTGAAADSSDHDEPYKSLPRLLRYAMLVSKSADLIELRLVAEIDELCPDLPLNVAWADGFDEGIGLALAAELDRCAVTQNEPVLRSLSDCVRLMSVPPQVDIDTFHEHRRVAKALLQAFYKLPRDTDPDLRCDLEQIVFGWTALPGCIDLVKARGLPAAASAVRLGKQMAEHRITEAWQQARRQFEETQKVLGDASTELDLAENNVADALPEHHLVVARLSEAQMKDPRLRSIVTPLKKVINAGLPLVQAPPLHRIRSTLLFEFPYAIDVIDFALADLVGRVTVRLRLLVGEPGGGKSRFARRLGEVLGLSVWRTDASQSDGAVFAGTDRRWHTSEPCHSLLAIAQGGIANPMVLVDELEKAGTRSDHGRLWDCLLGFLEPETSARYPDPALQVPVNLSQVSYVATANSLDQLPSPLRDRFRIITFPKPQTDDIDALLPAIITDLAAERGLDTRWVPPLDGVEREAITKAWRGGSVRSLRRIIEAVLRERDRNAPRN